MTDKSKFTNYNIKLVERRWPGKEGVQGFYIAFYDNSADMENDPLYGLRDSSYTKKLCPLYFKPDETLESKTAAYSWIRTGTPFASLDPYLQEQIRLFYDSKKSNPIVQKYVSSNGSTGGKKTKKSKKSRKPVKKQRKTRKHKK